MSGGGMLITKREALEGVRGDLVLWGLRFLTADTVVERFAAAVALDTARAMYRTIAGHTPPAPGQRFTIIGPNIARSAPRGT